MRVLRSRWLVALVISCSALSPLGAFAQETSDVQSLEKQLNDLQKQIDALSVRARELRQKLDTTGTEAVETPSDDLMSVEPIENEPPPTEAPVTPVTDEGPPEEPAAPEEPALPSDPIVNVTDSSAARIFNPDISVIGNFFAHFGDQNPFDPRDSASFDEAEFAFEAFVDPYAKARFYIAVTPEEVELEEGYVNFIALPWDLTAKVGKLKAAFGKANTWHLHVRPWVDQPLVINNFFGGEGLNDTGISVTKLIPNRFAYMELTAEVFSGHAEIFEPEQPNDLFYNTHLRVFRDITEDSNIELGASYARGTSRFGDEDAPFSGANQFAGVDFTYRWKPLARGTRQSFISRTEFIHNDRADQDSSGWGFYSSQDYQFARRWRTGIRIDRAAHPDALGVYDRGLAATLTFLPSEFSQFRAELRRIEYGEGLTANELLFQLQFAIGAHGAHTF